MERNPTRIDLTRFELSTAEGPELVRRPSGRRHRNDVTVLFDDLEREVCAFIRQSSIIVGCVAWLTNPRILTALARCASVAVVVQKEDFLRPDLGAGRSFEQQLRAQYDRLRGGIARFSAPPPLGQMSVATEYEIAPVRCVGVHNSDRKPAMPRMHHKFLVRCEEDPSDDEVWPRLVPTAVWTGSYNLTVNGGRSLENAVILTHPDLCSAYLNEWSFVEGMSEVLDWERPWVEPEWRIGT